MIKLIVGLGNPGPEYIHTRHNAGFWWVDAVAATLNAPWKSDNKFHGEIAKFNHQGHEGWLLKPMTFMNASGRSVVALAHYFKIMPDQILVVHDELDLPPGTARFKQGGGHGGHNGLKDIAAHLTTPNFWRLRLGIGHPGDRSQVVNFVLHEPSRNEQVLIEESMDAARAQLPLILKGEMNVAVKNLHTTPNK